MKKNFNYLKFFFLYMPFCYNQFVPLGGVATLAYVPFAFANSHFSARLLLLPLKSCDFRGPRKVHRTFWGGGKARKQSGFLPIR